jgi:hypothetical protein
MAGLKLSNIAVLAATQAATLRRDMRQHTGADPDATLGRLERLSAFADEAVRELERIDGDRRLTVQGRADARLQFVQQQRARIDEFLAPIYARLKEHTSSLVADLAEVVEGKAPTDPAWAAVDAVLALEFRRSAERLNDQGIELLYREGGAAIRRAMNLAPRIVVASGLPRVRPFVSDELRASVLREEAKQAAPEKARLLAAVEMAESTLRAVAGPLHAALEQIGTEAAATVRAMSTPRTNVPFEPIDPQTGERIPLPRA